MQRKGFIIRFIDIGLLILFGFLRISDLTVESQVQLPQDGGPDATHTETVTVTVEIGADGRFRVRDGGRGRVMSIQELEARLRAWRDEQRAARPTVNIKPHPDSYTQRTVDVMEVCVRLQLDMRVEAS